MRSKVHQEEVFDLMKIPVEALYREALCEIGEQEAYIEELKATIQQLEKENRELKNKPTLTNEENIAIGKEIKRVLIYSTQ